MTRSASSWLIAGLAALAGVFLCGAVHAQTYEPVADWLKLPAGRATLGPMHDGPPLRHPFRQFFARSLVEGTEFEDSPEAEEFFNQLFACTTVEG